HARAPSLREIYLSKPLYRPHRPGRKYLARSLPPLPPPTNGTNLSEEKASAFFLSCSAGALPRPNREDTCELHDRLWHYDGRRVQGPPAPGRRRRGPRRRRAVRGEDVPHGERPVDERRRALGRRRQHVPRARPRRLLRLPPPLLLQAPQLRQLRPAAQHLRIPQGGSGQVGVRARVVPAGAGAAAAADRAQEEEGRGGAGVQGAVRGRGGGAGHHRGGAAAAGGAEGHGGGAPCHGPEAARRREPPGPDDGVPRQARRRTGRRAARHARQEGGAGRGRQQRVRSLQEAADRGRHGARRRGDRRRRGRDGAEQRHRAVPVLCSWPSVLLAATGPDRCTRTQSPVVYITTV
uniref:Uncharacterized protein n=1 Tax=Oryza nivara TaxID=4536 RepID=A0A0E0FSR2_ORYNI